MALIHCNFFSEVLLRDVDIDVFIPTPNSDELLTKDKNAYYQKGQKYPCIYLLHGAYGDHTNWSRHTRVEKYGEANRVAVVMPSLENSFCMDMRHGERYRTFVGEELVKVSSSLFPISDKRKDLTIAGLSMGGFCAYYMAFQYPKVFARAASLSGALDIARLRSGEIVMDHSPFRWEDLYDLNEDTVDLLTLYDCIQGEKPALYQTCGTSDFLFDMNQEMNRRFVEKNAKIKYTTTEGTHDWEFWDKQLPDVLKWSQE